MATGRTFLVGAIGAAFLSAAGLAGQTATATLTVTLTVEPSLALVIDPPAETEVPSSVPQPICAIALGELPAVSLRVEAATLARSSSFLDSPRREGLFVTEARALPTVDRPSQVRRRSGRHHGRAARSSS